MHVRTLFAIAGLTLATTACGSDSKGTTDPGENNNGQTSFSASITGQLAESLSGEAAFAHDDTQQDVGFAMALGAASGDDAILVWRRNAGVLATGQHTVANYDAFEEEDIPANQLAIVVILEGTGGVPLMCASTGGTVNITSSGANRLRGSFNFTASCADLQTEQVRTVTVSGNFDAASGTVMVPE